MRIRRADRRDVEAWAAMRTELWPDADAGELALECADFFVQPRLIDVVFLAEADNGHVAGFVEVALRSVADGCKGSPVPYVEGWYVAPHARRQGVGKALIAAAERWATGLGFDEIASDVVIGNSASENAHMSLGFQEVERAIHFRKSLTPSGGRTTP